MMQETGAESLVDKRGERVRTMFASVARRYDLLNHLLSLNIDKRWRKKVLAKLPAPPNGRVLDVCTGTGDLAMLYAQRSAAGTKVTGIDFCGEMLEIARKKGAKANLQIEWLEGDAQNLPFEDRRFDVVTCAFGLRNVSDTNAGLAEMIRVTKPGGWVGILEFSRPNLPLLKSLYLAYFKHILPRIGKSVSPTSGDAYDYLPASVLSFPDGRQLTDRMDSLGLTSTSFRPFTLGIATLYTGQKPVA